MQRAVVVLVAISALIYIGQFLWSFKTEADHREIAERDKARAIIHNELAKLCSPEDRINNPEACRPVPE